MSDSSNSKNAEKSPNRLAFEKSPYLLQHAYNPVDWYPWGPEVFEKAQRENKLIFLSIGYSTCHWCHVMAHESFEDPEVARLMNEAFVSVKVDREERPDIDNLYMNICQIISGNCGWPLNIIMTPDRKPFFAGTYFPKETRSERIGMLELIPKIEELWITRPEDLMNSADEIIEALRNQSKLMPSGELGEGTLKLAFEQLSQSYDQEYGGFEGAPKFPIPHNISFLFRYWKRFGDKRALRMAEKTLQSMRRGGIYDHIGFGFHRYSTDSKWLVPHFEKMLYDQALLAMAYLEAYQATQEEEYGKTAKEILTYILRDMNSPEGGFYSAEDAESEGEEGKFYLWTEEEIRQILGKEADRAVKIFNIKESGNFIVESSETKNGKNILHVTRSFADIAYEMKMPEQELRRTVENIQKRLLTVREKRVHPHKDDKILTDWNGLIIAALAKGAKVFDEFKYTEAAKSAVDFILKNMRGSDGRLLHRYRDGQSAVPAYLDDYAFLIWGLIELYEANFDANYLQIAIALNDDLLKRFWDNESGGFYFTSNDSETPLFRRREIYDGAIPSGNSVEMLNLLRLSHITGNPELHEKACLVERAFSANVEQSPSSSTQLLVGVDFRVGPTYELVIAGNSEANDTKEMLKIIKMQFLPNKTLILNPTDQDKPDILRLAEHIRDQTSIGGKATAYVCIGNICKEPTTTIEKLMESLDLEIPRTGAK